MTSTDDRSSTFSMQSELLAKIC